MVVVELNIVYEKGCELVKVAPVVSIEQRGIRSGAGAVEILLILNLVEREDVLCGRVLSSRVAKKYDRNCHARQDREQSQPSFHKISLSGKMSVVRVSTKGNSGMFLLAL